MLCVSSEGNATTGDDDRGGAPSLHPTIGDDPADGGTKSHADGERRGGQRHGLAVEAPRFFVV